MKNKNIVIGQTVSKEKVELAKELRKQMTVEESILWAHLRRNEVEGLHFRRQQVIDGWIVDFYCHETGLIVELDGGIHDERIEYDQERDRALSERGFTILRIRNQAVQNNLKDVLDQIRTSCESPYLPVREEKAGEG